MFISYKKNRKIILLHIRLEFVFRRFQICKTYFMILTTYYEHAKSILGSTIVKYNIGISKKLKKQKNSFILLYKMSYL